MSRTLHRTVLTALSVLAVSACDQQSTPTGFEDAPGLTAARLGLPTLAGKSLLHWNTALAEAQADTVTISNGAGGWLSVPAGLEVYVPAGALGSNPSDSLTIILTAAAGGDVKWEFAPHGYSFHEDLEIRVTASNTNASGLLGLPGIEGLVPGLIGIYFQEGWFGLNVLQVFGVDVESGDFVFETDHFSGYALAM